jgi:hypothetical protein
MQVFSRHLQRFNLFAFLHRLWQVRHGEFVMGIMRQSARCFHSYRRFARSDRFATSNARSDGLHEGLEDEVNPLCISRAGVFFLRQ